jgi:hypothetical protein
MLALVLLIFLGFITYSLTLIRLLLIILTKLWGLGLKMGS